MPLANILKDRLPANTLFWDTTNQGPLTGGVTVTAYNIGVVSSGTTTINCGNGPLQYMTNNGAFTLAAPANDGSCVLQILNGASAGAMATSGWQNTASGTGDAYVTTNGNIYNIHIVRINGNSTFVIHQIK